MTTPTIKMESQDDGHPDRTYTFLYDSVNRFLKRERERSMRDANSNSVSSSRTALTAKQAKKEKRREEKAAKAKAKAAAAVAGDGGLQLLLGKDAAGHCGCSRFWGRGRAAL